jgi:hypothetical protein
MNKERLSRYLFSSSSKAGNYCQLYVRHILIGHFNIRLVLIGRFNVRLVLIGRFNVRLVLIGELACREGSAWCASARIIV